MMTEDEALVRYLSEEERQQPAKVSTVLRLHRLNTAEKLITALKGSREERAILIRDPNRLVATAVLGSPRLTDSEIEAISAMKGVSDEILRKIGHHREWTKRYTVVKNLVRNRRTPEDIVRSLRARLSPRDISVDRDTSEREEQDLRARLVGLFVSVNHSLGALGTRLKVEQSEEIEAILDRARAALRGGWRDELETCVREMVRASRLLQERASTSRAGSQPPRPQHLSRELLDPSRARACR